MDVFTQEEFQVNFDDHHINIESGVLFIHPTDTIYGIGCDATQPQAVEKVRDIKNRQHTPFSIIAPSKEWIHKNCHVPEEATEWVDKLPGPYTLILKIKDKTCVAPNVNLGYNTLGVRIPDHWFSEVVEKLGKPIVTTSANKKGENFMTSLANLSHDVKTHMHFIVYEDEKHGKPSTIVDLTKEQPLIKKR